MGPLIASEVRPTIWRALLKRVVAVFAVILVMDLLLFIPAGRLDWPAARILSLLYGVFLLVYVVWVRSKPRTCSWPHWFSPGWMRAGFCGHIRR
jgi:hypothetical protein